VLKDLLGRSDLGEKLAQATVVPEWEDRVGPAIAAVTTPLRVSHGVLLVGVRSSPWLMELRLMEREILERINAERSGGRIQGIRFVMSDES
jgi:predicted nucleic acid-binding Zn ribbon protein